MIAAKYNSDLPAYVALSFIRTPDEPSVKNDLLFIFYVIINSCFSTFIVIFLTVIAARLFHLSSFTIAGNHLLLLYGVTRNRACKGKSGDSNTKRLRLIKV